MGEANRRRELGLVRPREPAWTPFERGYGALPEGHDPTRAECWVNSRYQVLKVDFGALWWLSIRRHDKLAIHDWRDFQRIKNELVGLENEGVELYPAESRLVDCANQYHLWVGKLTTLRFPFGFPERVVQDADGDGWRADGSRQRPLADGAL